MRLYTNNLKTVFLLYICICLCMTGCAGRFDAAQYTQALLDLTFQGDTEPAMKVMEEPSYQSLRQLYIESVDTFTTSIITNSLEVNDDEQERFCQLVAKIFQTMRYYVKEDRKIKRNVYEVSVIIQPADVFVNFKELLAEDSAELARDIREGRYEGTKEEVNTQVMHTIVEHAYELLDYACEEVRYGKETRMVLTVRRDENGEYAADSEDMDDLMVKILRLDEM